MSTRLILNGRVYEYGNKARAYSTEMLEHPLGYVNPPQNEYIDGPWKLRYRLMDRANEGESWLTMPEIKDLLKQPEVWVAMQVQNGAIDAAMVRGSGIPIFRIRNRTAMIQQVLIAPVEVPKSAEVRKQPRKDKERWDK